MERVYPQNWMALSKDVREVLAVDFSVTRSGITEVRDQTVVTDGRTVEDLMVFSKDSMSAYVDETESFGRLWELVVAKAKNKLNPVTIDLKDITVMPQVEVRENLLENLKPIEDTIAEIRGEKKFCDSCESKGVRHLKVCPKYVAIIK